MAIFKVLLLLIVGGTGIWYAARHLRRNWQEMRAKTPAAAQNPSDPLAAHRGSGKRPSTSDLVFNYGLSFVWFGYLLAFFAGLIVNNLLLK